MTLLDGEDHADVLEEWINRSSPTRARPEEDDDESDGESSQASRSTESSSEDEELEDDDDDDDDEFVCTIARRNIGAPERADLRPHGRSKRQSAAAASEAWRKLGPRKHQRRDETASLIDSIGAVPETPKRGRGRPKGSKNKKTLASPGKAVQTTPHATPDGLQKRGRGRPKGSKNKPKPALTPSQVALLTPMKRRRSFSGNESDGTSSSEDEVSDSDLRRESDEEIGQRNGFPLLTPTKFQLVPQSPQKSIASTTPGATSGTPLSATASVETPIKRGRGRPRKYPINPAAQVAPSPVSEQGQAHHADQIVTPRKRGRPPKTPNKESQSLTPSRIENREAEHPFSAKANGNHIERIQPLIKPTSSDAYFIHHAPQKAAKKQTSDTVLSDRLPRISSRAVASLTRRIAEQVQASARVDAEPTRYGQGAFMTLSNFDQFFDDWYALLCGTQRPLLFYGVGSKRAPLQNFAKYLARQGLATAIIVRGEAGGRLEEIVCELERMLSVAPASDISKVRRAASATALDARVEYLLLLLDAAKRDKDLGKRLPPSILVVVHNIDTTTIMQARSLYLLGRLNCSERIHVIADTSHINAGMLAGSTGADADGNELLPWLWIDVTTHVPMLDEILSERGPGTARQLGLPAVLDIRTVGGGSDVEVLAYDVGPSASERARRGLEDVDNTQRNLSDRAAIHILRSVTFKARGLFLLLANRLLQESRNDKEAGKTQTTYDELAQLARNNFLAMTPDALRSLLVEFTSHGLITIGDGTVDPQGPSSQQAVMDGDYRNGNVRIALGLNDLARVVEEFKATG